MKKAFLLLTALTLSVGLWALDNVHYIDADGQEYTVDNVTEITNSSTTLSGWCVVLGNNVTTGSLVCTDDVHLILADGASLTATAESEEQAGIQVSNIQPLTIYGQSSQSGQLFANGGYCGAGIGGRSESSSSNITINGGNVTAIGGYAAAGIGGGAAGSGFNISINRGSVKATGGTYGAGIGGGNGGDGSYIDIYGGIVEAIGGSEGAGIGGGLESSGSYIKIHGGTVKVKSIHAAAGIGGGNKGSGSNIDIYGGSVTVEGAEGALTVPASDAIGSGVNATVSASNIRVATSLLIKADGYNPPTTVIENDGTDIASSFVGKRYATIESPAGPTPIPTTYIDGNGEVQNIDALEVNNASEQVTWGEDGEIAWYVVNATDVQITKGAVCVGDVRLILADGAQLTATGLEEQAGIQVSGENNSFIIYAQSSQTGRLITNGGNNAAGIGGCKDEDGGNITIHGGTVTANGGEGAAGIGGGAYGSGYNIIVNGGTVIANGGDNASGIGDGFRSHSVGAAEIYISDAYVLKAGDSETLTDDDIVDHSSAEDLGGTLNGQYVKIEGLATPYTRSMTSSQWATVCLPYAATSFSGATFYKINYYDGADKLYIEEVSTLEAGMPYIFQATSETVTINHEASSPMICSNEQTERGLHGSFARKVVESDGNQAAINGGQVVIVDNGSTVTVPACRAYIDMSEVPTTEQPHSAPLRCMGVPRQTPTGLEQSVTSNQQSVIKMIKDGQFRIVKDNKMYNAQGQIFQ